MPLRSPGAAVVPSRSCRRAAPAARAARAGEPARHGATRRSPIPRGSARPGAAGIQWQPTVLVRNASSLAWRARAAVSRSAFRCSSASSPRRRFRASLRASGVFFCRSDRLPNTCRSSWSMRSFVTCRASPCSAWVWASTRTASISSCAAMSWAVSACRSAAPASITPCMATGVSPTRATSSSVSARISGFCWLCQACRSASAGWRGRSWGPSDHGADTASIRGEHPPPDFDRCTPATCNPASSEANVAASSVAVRAPGRTAGRAKQPRERRL